MSENKPYTGWKSNDFYEVQNMENNFVSRELKCKDISDIKNNKLKCYDSPNKCYLVENNPEPSVVPEGTETDECLISGFITRTRQKKGNNNTTSINYKAYQKCEEECPTNKTEESIWEMVWIIIGSVGGGLILIALFKAGWKRIKE